MNEYDDLVERIADLLGFPEFPEPNEDQCRNDVIENFLRDALNKKIEEPPNLKQLVGLEITPEERGEVALLLRTKATKIFAVKYLYEIYKTKAARCLEACRDTVNLVILEERIPAFYATTWHQVKNQNYEMRGIGMRVRSIGKGDPSDEESTN